MAPSNGTTRPLHQNWSSPSAATIAHYNGTLQWHHDHSTKIGRHPPPPNHSTLQWHPAMAPRPLHQNWSSPPPPNHSTLQWHPAMAPWCHFVGLPPIGSKNPYSYRYLGNKQGVPRLIDTTWNWRNGFVWLLLPKLIKHSRPTSFEVVMAHDLCTIWGLSHFTPISPMKSEPLGDIKTAPRTAFVGCQNALIRHLPGSQQSFLGTDQQRCFEAVGYVREAAGSTWPGKLNCHPVLLSYDTS